MKHYNKDNPFDNKTVGGWEMDLLPDVYLKKIDKLLRFWDTYIYIIEKNNIDFVLYFYVQSMNRQTYFGTNDNANLPEQPDVIIFNTASLIIPVCWVIWDDRRLKSEFYFFLIHDIYEWRGGR